MHRGSGHQLAVLNQAELGCPSTNVDVEDALLVVEAAFGRP